MNISKDQFNSYVALEHSAAANMLDIRMVCKMSGLNKRQVEHIMENYSDLMNEYYEKSM